VPSGAAARQERLSTPDFNLDTTLLDHRTRAHEPEPFARNFGASSVSTCIVRRMHVTDADGDAAGGGGDANASS